MTAFDKAIEFVLQFEGGYVNDPTDPGGETKYGIAKRSYPSLNIADLTKEDAVHIYQRDYWQVCKCDMLPSPIAILVFDTAVNQGTDAAIRLLQAALGVNVDGVIGPATIDGARRSDFLEAISTFTAGRCMRYALNPNVKRFGSGWFRRVVACLQTALQPL